MEAIMFIILQIFFVTRTVLKIGEYSEDMPQFGNILSLMVFRLIARERRYLLDIP